MNKITIYIIFNFIEFKGVKLFGLIILIILIIFTNQFFNIKHTYLYIYNYYNEYYKFS